MKTNKEMGWTAMGVMTLAMTLAMPAAPWAQSAMDELKKEAHVGDVCAMPEVPAVTVRDVAPEHKDQISYGYLNLRGFKDDKAMGVVLDPLFEQARSLGAVVRYRLRNTVEEHFHGLITDSRAGCDVIFHGPKDKVADFVDKLPKQPNLAGGMIGEVDAHISLWDGKSEIHHFEDFAKALEYAQTVPLRRASHFKGRRNSIEYYGYSADGKKGSAPFYVGW